jgi:hypothetical protein
MMNPVWWQFWSEVLQLAWRSPYPLHSGRPGTDSTITALWRASVSVEVTKGLHFALSPIHIPAPPGRLLTSRGKRSAVSLLGFDCQT